MFDISKDFVGPICYQSETDLQIERKSQTFLTLGTLYCIAYNTYNKNGSEQKNNIQNISSFVNGK